ncbi:MAG: M14 family metallopeptidase [Pseudomonadota bacterium]
MRVGIFLVMLACLGPAADASDTLTIGTLSARPGEIMSGPLAVPTGADQIRTHIPLTLINGANTGPVLTLVAGIHGAEYPPILAMQRLATLVDPAELRGAIIIVHIANLPSFQRRTIYVGPHDLKNLNRSFPGNIDGTVTERIAATLTESVIARSDFLIDIHAGDSNEGLRPNYSAYYAEAGSEQLIAQSKRIAKAFGLDYIVQFRGTVDSVEKAIYTSAQAVALGIPAMDVESGEVGRRDEVYVAPIVEGVFGVLYELDMLDGEVRDYTPLYIGSRARVYSQHEGIWYPNERIELGDFVTQGADLGRITDYFGNTLQQVVAPASGILLIRFATPPVNVRDNIVVIGAVDQPID